MDASSKLELAEVKESSTTGESDGYRFNKKGQLIVNGYPFMRAAVLGVLNTSILWRCAELRKYKCTARVKTIGRNLESINIDHNHSPRVDKQFNSIIWQEAVDSIELDQSKEN